jgi:hypothetical protein
MDHKPPTCMTWLPPDVDTRPVTLHLSTLVTSRLASASTHPIPLPSHPPPHLSPLRRPALLCFRPLSHTLPQTPLFTSACPVSKSWAPSPHCRHPYSSSLLGPCPVSYGQVSLQRYPSTDTTVRAIPVHVRVRNCCVTHRGRSHTRPPSCSTSLLSAGIMLTLASRSVSPLRHFTDSTQP